MDAFATADKVPVGAPVIKNDAQDCGGDTVSA